ncbi:DNA ligase 1 isoform X2 [Camellia sinensis]|uniref:DEK-C domain-containing protein n=1 Tax=Camellia sinensis var. sinensis TaxID=542762 RepID=A0A4S4EY84_CAMSN|nr:DNA ligase 1 isoform X2 [Camellia sinensis]THG21565.1 hypothetical protein TEA_007939 [Camellia sinensis var. sinensis]
MGEEEAVVAVEAEENGTTTPENKGEDVPQKKELEKDGVKEMEEDGKDDEKVETEEMDVDQEAKKTKEEEKIAKKGSKEEEEEEEKKVDTRSEAMDDEMEAKEAEEGEEKVVEKVDELKEEEENDEDCKPEKVDELKEEEEKDEASKPEKKDELIEEEEKDEESTPQKASKRRGKGKTSAVKINSNKKEVEGKKEWKTPISSALDRPVRERKSVERLVASFEIETVKEFHIEKGSGVALKDIPNVSYKLSKRKTDDTLKLLHTILFGRRGKAAQVKSNISRFSGFVWNDNEEKQKIKVKEKLDKCIKEKLLEFCDVLDMPVTKANTRKEDIVAKLIDFLVAPHALTTELLAEKEQSSKGKKRKREVKRSASTSGSTPSKRSAKSRKRIENASKETENMLETEDELDKEEEEEEEHEEEETVNGVPESSESDVPEENKDESEEESEEDTGKYKRGSKNSSAKKKSSGKTKTKKVATLKKSTPPTKKTPLKSTPPTKRTPLKSSSNRSKVDDSSDSPKTFSRKKRTEVVKEKSTAPKKPASMEQTGKKVAKGKDKPKEVKLRPSDDELRKAICEILKEVDFNTATFTDILKQLAGRFKMDLTPRKASIKFMIQEELTKLADEADDEEDEGDTEKDKTQPSGQGVEA